MIVCLAVEWLKDGKVLQESAKHQLKSLSKTKFQLQVATCAIPDMGQYSIKVAGKKGASTASFTNNVVPASTAL